MIPSNKITDSELKICREEYDRLIVDKQRIELQMNAILTTAALRLAKRYDTNRLDYVHLSNAYNAYLQKDTESMQFKVVDMTIRNLFLNNDEKFKFVNVENKDSCTYEFLYSYGDKLILISIPAVSNIDENSLDVMDWGVITVHEFLNSEYLIPQLLIAQSDDYNIVSSCIKDYLNLAIANEENNDVE